MKTKMATPIKVRGCIVTPCGVSPLAVGTRKYMNVQVKGRIYIKGIKSLPCMLAVLLFKDYFKDAKYRQFYSHSNVIYNSGINVA